MLLTEGQREHLIDIANDAFRRIGPLALAQDRVYRNRAGVGRLPHAEPEIVGAAAVTW